MNTATPNTPLDRLYRDLGFQPLSHWWGRVEMFAGLVCMGVATFGMILLSNEVLRQTLAAAPSTTTYPVQDFDFPYLPVIGTVLLFALGGYLTLVGHRRHLYESNDRLTAYLADMLRPAGAAPTPVPAAAGAATDGRLAPAL